MVRVVRKVFLAEKVHPWGDVHIIFVDNSFIRRLNRQFLKERSNTDVIAFPYENTKAPSNEKIFSDVYISVPQAFSNARLFHDSFNREITRLVVHGLLHILGYSDHKTALRKKMWKKQESLVDFFHLSL